MKTEIKAGIFISLAYFIWLLIEFKLGLHGARIDYYPFVFWLALIIPITGIYLTIRFIRDTRHKGKINFVQGFSSGLKITGVMSILIPLLSWLYVSVINPTYFTAMKAYQEKMIEELNLSSNIEKEIQIKEIAINNSTASFLTRQFVILVISGVILSVLVALLIKKENIISQTRNKSGQDSDTPKI